MLEAWRRPCRVRWCHDGSRIGPGAKALDWFISSSSAIPPGSILGAFPPKILDGSLAKPVPLSTSPTHRRLTASQTVIGKNAFSEVIRDADGQRSTGHTCSPKTFTITKTILFGAELYPVAPLRRIFDRTEKPDKTGQEEQQVLSAAAMKCAMQPANTHDYQSSPGSEGERSPNDRTHDLSKRMHRRSD